MSKGKNNDDYVELSHELDSEVIITLGVIEVVANYAENDYFIHNTKTFITTHYNTLMEALLASQNEANAWSSVCETKKKQDLEDSTGILLPDNKVVVPLPGSMS